MYMLIVSVVLHTDIIVIFLIRVKAKPWQEIIMLYCGLLWEDPLTWVGVHRMHHAYATQN